MEDKSWIEILTALLTPTIACCAVLIAWQQWRTAERKIKQDLFNKRYAFFKRMWTIFASRIGEPEGPIEDTILLDYVHEAEFLFGEDIVNHLFKIPEKQAENCLDYDWFSSPFKKYMQLY